MLQTVQPNQKFYVIKRTANKHWECFSALCCFRDQQGDNTIFYCKVKEPTGIVLVRYESERRGNYLMFATKHEAQKEANRLNLHYAVYSIVAKCIKECPSISVGETYFVDDVIAGNKPYVSLIGKDGWYPAEYFELHENDVLIDVTTDVRFLYQFNEV